MTNKKGVEAFPFFLFLTILVAAVVLTLGFYQIQSFSEFSSKKEIADSYKSLIDSMEKLRLTADKGSFTRVSLKVPSGYKIFIWPENNTIIIEDGGNKIVNNLDFDILYSTVPNPLEAGTYNIEVYYGNVTNPEPYTIYFV